MRRLALAFCLVLLVSPAFAQICSVPNVFVNGTTADATQVNTNFTSLVNCANTLLAPLASPNFTGVPSAPTASPGTNTTQLATTAFVQAALPTGANPTAIADQTAINGSATTFMRSDGAPAIAVATNTGFGLVKFDDVTIGLNGSNQLEVQSTTVAGATCTPGSSCTPAASGLSNGVTGSGAIVLATGPTISAAAIGGGWQIDDTSGTFANVPLGGGSASACWENASSPFVLSRGTSGCGSSAKRFKNIYGLVTPDQARRGLDELHAVTGWWKDQRAYDDREHVWLLADDVAKMDARCGVWEEGKIKNYDERCVIAYLVEDRKALWHALRR